MKRLRESFKTIVTIAALFIAGSSAFGQTVNLKDIVNPKYYDELIKEGMVRIIHPVDDLSLQLLPETGFKKQCLENTIPKEQGNYPFVTESLYFMPKSEILKASNSTKSDITLEEISVIFRSISKMQGMQYYSENKKKPDTLYKEAWAVDGPVTRQKIPDQTAGSANGKVLYAYQNDASFGKTVYELHYYQDANSLYAVFNNLDSMGIGPIQAVNPRNMKINVIAIDCGENLCLYLETDTDCKKFPGIAKTLENSLTSRMDAIKEWFIRQF